VIGKELDQGYAGAATAPLMLDPEQASEHASEGALQYCYRAAAWHHAAILEHDVVCCVRV
jgi:hypothetical protein